MKIRQVLKRTSSREKIQVGFGLPKCNGPLWAGRYEVLRMVGMPKLTHVACVNEGFSLPCALAARFSCVLWLLSQPHPAANGYSASGLPPPTAADRAPRAQPSPQQSPAHPGDRR
jgi:hypothetical protein